MATSKATVNNTEWTLILNGAGFIQLKSRGHIHVHIGATVPALDTEVFHPVPRSDGIDFSYSGTENVYCMNGDSDDMTLICTEIV